MRIDVPYFEQTLDFSCGPACLTMILHHFDRSIPLGRSTELAIWREANMVESHGTSGLGLALAAHRRGLAAQVINSRSDLPLRERVLEHFPDADPAVLDLFYEDLLERGRRAGIVPEVRATGLDDLRAALDAGRLPLLLTSTRIGVPGEHIPHWVVVTGYERGAWFVNNPYTDGRPPVPRVSEAQLGANLGWEGDQSLVLLAPPDVPRG